MTNSDSSPTLVRRKRERERRRQLMLSAAQAVFAEKGYAHATLDEIAERAQFGKGTLYNYFDGGKEGILLAVLDNLFDETRQLLETSLACPHQADRPLSERYQSFVEQCFHFFEEREEQFFLLVKEVHRLALNGDSEHVAYFRGKQEAMVATLVPVLQDAVEQGEIRPLPLRAVAYMMIENVNGMLMHRAMTAQLEPDADTLLHHPEQAAGFLKTILFDGLSEESSPHRSR